MSSRKRGIDRRRGGFTLIELLVVIAIIAILAALLLPVFSMVREQTRKSQCKNQLATILAALKTYRNDHGVYPDALYGVSYNGGPVEPRLFARKYVQKAGDFTCPNHAGAQRPVTELVIPVNKMTGEPAKDRFGRTMGYPVPSSYDFQFHPNQATGAAEQHYRQKWTVSTSAATDDKRQLYYKDPPGDTVVTWCLCHATLNAAGQATGGKAVVGLLSGRVVEVDATRMVGWPGPDGKHPWQVSP